MEQEKRRHERHTRKAEEEVPASFISIASAADSLADFKASTPPAEAKLQEYASEQNRLRLREQRAAQAKRDAELARLHDMTAQLRTANDKAEDLEQQNRHMYKAPGDPE